MSAGWTSTLRPVSPTYVEETRFGFWFLQSHVWQHHVLRVAINDLVRLIGEPLPHAPVLLDAGCGQGRSFGLLDAALSPTRMIGLDADPHSLECSRREAERLGLDVELMLLVERTDELAGARGGAGTAYTLRFAHDGVDLLLRVSSDGDSSRIDGWVVPPAPIAVVVQRDVGAGWTDHTTVDIGDAGRFELPGLHPGMLRLRLEPADGSTSFLTPAFEI